MKSGHASVFLLILLAFSACSRTTIVPFTTAPGGQAIAYPPTRAEEVGIYRSTRPFEPFLEIGLITIKARSLNLPALYNELRTESAARGAEAVIDVKLNQESHIETHTMESCIPESVCSMPNVCTTINKCAPTVTEERVTTYLVEGTMIRRKL